MFQTEYNLYVSQIRNFKERVQRAICSDETDVKCKFAWSKDPVPFEKRKELTYRPITKGEKWGEDQIRARKEKILSFISIQWGI